MPTTTATTSHTAAECTMFPDSFCCSTTSATLAGFTTIDISRPKRIHAFSSANIAPRSRRRERARQTLARSRQETNQASATVASVVATVVASIVATKGDLCPC